MKRAFFLASPIVALLTPSDWVEKMQAHTRVDNFHGNETEYTAYLESKVHFLEARLLEIRQQYLTPPPEVTPRLSHDTPSLLFRFYDGLPPLKCQCKAKSRTTEPKWREEIRAFIADIPAGDEWADEKRCRGFGDVEQNHCAIEVILGISTFTEETFEVEGGPASFPEVDSAQLLLLYPARDFACRTQRLTTAGAFAAIVGNFQKLVLATFPICCSDLGAQLNQLTRL